MVPTVRLRKRQHVTLGAGHKGTETSALLSLGPRSLGEGGCLVRGQSGSQSSAEPGRVQRLGIPGRTQHCLASPVSEPAWKWTLHPVESSGHCSLSRHPDGHLTGDP